MPRDGWRPRFGTRPTKREMQVLAWSLFFGQKEAAHRLGITDKTVKHTLTGLYERIGASRGTEAAAILGWLQIPPEVFDNVGRETKTWSRAIIAKTCRQCGSVFFGRRVDFDEDRGMYCTVSCARTGKPTHGGKMTYKCGHCRKDFTVTGSRARAGQRFCSRSCARRAREIGRVTSSPPMSLPTMLTKVRATS